MIFNEPILHFPIPFDPDLGQQASDRFSKSSQNARKLIAGVAGSSPYLNSLITRHDDWLSSVLELSPEQALEKAHALEGDIATALRLAKARVSLVLALCDLAHIRPLEWVTENLTKFADFSVQTALQSELRNAVDKGKLAQNAIKDGMSAGMVVLAMGKMGAHELNYSSDIDLIFLFDDSRFPSDEVYEYRATFVQITRRVFETLNKQRGDGYVFRTDLRLRPNPAVTPVCPAMSSAEAYYVREGRTWERSAFIKARPCAGDLDAGNAFLKRLQGFIWRRHLDYAAISEIEDILTLSREHKRLTGPIELLGHDMKMGRGGIREIEFFAQTQQLSFGGRHPELREITTLGALSALGDAGRISNQIVDLLSQNYRAHRQIEHRVQMLRDVQTHKVPNSDEEFNRLRCLSGFTDDDAFRKFILTPLESTRTATKMEKTTHEQVAVPTSEQLTLFDTWKNLSAFKTERAASIFERQLPAVWALAEEQPNPTEALEYFDHFLSGLSSGVQLFSLFEQRPDVLRQAFEICCLSKQLARDLAQRTNVLDAMADGGIQAMPNSVSAFDASLDARLTGTEDFESLLIQLRSWKSEEQFKIVFAQLSLLIDTQTAEAAYSNLAEVCLQRALNASKSEVQRRYGVIENSHVAVLAMGKLGSREMTATSDLDIIVIYDGPSDATSSIKDWDIRSYYQKLTRTLVTALSSSMSFGRLYEVDMRLRPSGRAGTVATSIDAFEDYQHNKAWVWEHLALTRARVAAGDPELASKIATVNAGILGKDRDHSDVLREVMEMRERLDKVAPEKASSWPVKKPLGGVLDIELCAQTLNLLSKGNVRKPAEQLEAAVNANLINSSQFENLQNSHALFGQIEHLKRLLGLKAFDSTHLSESAALLFSKAMDVGSLNLLERALADALNKNRKIIQGVLDTLDPELGEFGNKW